MTPLLRSAALTAVLSATLSTGLVAQRDKPDSPANPACSLLTEEELHTATGLDFGPAEPIASVGHGTFGGASCLWGGVWDEDTSKSLPELGVEFIPPRPRGSNTEFYRVRKPEANCTRETLRGVGDIAFADSCQNVTLPAVRVYAKAGRNDVFVEVGLIDKRRPLSWARPVAVALAKAAVLRARKL